MRNTRLFLILLTAAALLLVPAVAMQFTDEVKWDRFDFFVAGILLFGTAIMCEIALRLINTNLNRIIAVGLILIALFIVWAELAVGLIGTRFAGS